VEGFPKLTTRATGNRLGASGSGGDRGGETAGRAVARRGEKLYIFLVLKTPGVTEGQNVGQWVNWSGEPPSYSKKDLWCRVKNERIKHKSRGR